MRLKNSIRLCSAFALSLLLGTTTAFAQLEDDDGENDDDSAEEDDEEEDDEAEEAEPEDDDSDEAGSKEVKSTTDKDETKSESGDQDEQAAAKTDDKDGDCTGDDCGDVGKKPDPKSDKDEKAEEEPEEVAASEPTEEEPVVEEPGADEAANQEAADAAVTDFPEPGPSLSPLKITTSTFTRFEVRENYDSLGLSQGRTMEGDMTVFRARLGFETNPLPLRDGSDVLVKVSPQASGQWGQNGSVGEANVGFFDGYLKFRTKRLDTTIGRQQIAYGDDLMIGTLDWNQIGRAFDGVRFHYKMDKGYVDFLGLQTGEAHPAGGERLLGGDEYLWGVYSGFGGYIDDDIETDLYVLAKSVLAQDAYTDPASGDIVNAEGGTLFTAGGRVKHRVGSFDYRMEAGVQLGEKARSWRESATDLTSPSAFAYQVDGDIGFWFGHATRIGFGGAFASGDDPTTRGNEGWDQLYPTAHKFLGLTDIIGARTNIASGNIAITRGITDSLSLQIDGHVFARPEDGGQGQVGVQDMAGVEVDTQMTHKLGKYASVRGLYGLFIPSSGHYASDDLVSYGEVQAGVTF